MGLIRTMVAVDGRRLRSADISDLEVQTTLRALLNRVYELERGEAAATTTENAAPVASGSAPAPAAGEDLPAFGRSIVPSLPSRVCAVCLVCVRSWRSHVLGPGG